MLDLSKHKGWSRAILAIELVALVVVLSLFVPIYAEICQQSANGTHEQCASYHIGPFVLLWVIGVINEYSGLVSAFAGIAVAAFTFTLWRSTDKLWDAGEKQLRHSEQTAERQLRAYLGFRIGDATIKVGENPVLEIIIFNSGQTPAYDAMPYDAGSVIPLADADDLDVTPPASATGATVMVIAPNGADHKAIVTREGALTDEELASMKAGTHGFFARGGITYWDTFRRTRRHSTFIVMIGKTELEVKKASFWRRGNDAN